MENAHDLVDNLEDGVPSTTPDIEKVAVAATNPACAVRGRVPAEYLEEPSPEINRPMITQPSHVLAC